MHRSARSTLLAIASACLLVLPAFAAPVELDPPSASATSDASSIVDVAVTAGTSGAPNGFTVEWMTRALFEQLGGAWPADASDPNILSATFLGTPTLNTVDGTRTFLLNPGQVAMSPRLEVRKLPPGSPSASRSAASAAPCDGSFSDRSVAGS